MGSTSVGTENVILPAWAAAVDARAELGDGPEARAAAAAATRPIKNGRYLRTKPPPLTLDARHPSQAPGTAQATTVRDTGPVESNVLGGPLESCSSDPLT